jgi:hypothetical protein
MIFQRIVKGPQIHFWISDKEVTPAKTCSSACPAEQPAEGFAAQQNELAIKRQVLPRYFHVEIF